MPQFNFAVIATALKTLKPGIGFSLGVDETGNLEIQWDPTEGFVEPTSTELDAAILAEELKELRQTALAWLRNIAAEEYTLDGYQADIYKQKLVEAQAYDEAVEKSDTLIPQLASEATVRELTSAQMVAAVLSRATFWKDTLRPALETGRIEMRDGSFANADAFTTRFNALKAEIETIISGAPSI